ncbi:MAG: NAD(P)/FAD-dependent oxidoreductase [Desulfovibrio sp.]|jgi:all-trans-retinol 13,14-reductase|nr:NAD(P)/FAD-dependent oxidoreductase [Desulfovibrio sp.]
MSSPGKSIVVIGGGVSGMATALVLAKHGRAVCLVEKKPKLGATLRGFSRCGAIFDTGLHYAGGLHPEGALTRYFRLLGLESLPLVEFNRNDFDHVRFIASGREIALPVGHEAILDTLCGHFPADRVFLRDYFKRLRNSFFSSAFLYFSTEFRAAMNEALHQESLATVLAKGTGDRCLRTVLSIHSLLYGVSPEETPFIQHARIAGSYLEGVKTVAGGGRVLAEAMEAKLDEAGVEIHRGVAVTKLLFAGGKDVTEVSLGDGRHISAEGVVFTAHPAFLPPMLPDGAVKPAFIRRLQSLEDTFSSYTLFGKSDSPIPALHGSNLFLCLEDDISRAFRPDCRAECGPFYISGSPAPHKDTSTDTDTAQRTGWGLTAFAPGNANECAPWAASRPGSRPDAYKAFKTRRLDCMRAVLLEHCPELTSVTFLEGGTPLTNRDFLDSPGCGLYGTKHSLKQFSPLPATRVANLWMAGQSVIAPGILGAIISAFVACGFILGMDTVRREIAACA